MLINVQYFSEIYHYAKLTILDWMELLWSHVPSSYTQVCWYRQQILPRLYQWHDTLIKFHKNWQINAYNINVCNLTDKITTLQSYNCNSTHPFYNNHEVYGKKFMEIMFYFSNWSLAVSWCRMVHSCNTWGGSLASPHLTSHIWIQYDISINPTQPVTRIFTSSIP
jgi:hypothetical protein